MNCSTVDIPFFSEALLGERIWVMEEKEKMEKEKKKKKLIWRFFYQKNWTRASSMKDESIDHYTSEEC